MTEPVQLMDEHLERIPSRSARNRTFDLVCSAAGLLFLSPLSCAIALAIKLHDGGPIFFTQIRVGRYFRPFRIFKFRTMIAGAERNGRLTACNDSRVTSVGRFLRRHKLDELPQLLNVFKGEMQLVGARPELQRYVEMFQAEYAEILQEAPGITDPASLAYRNEDALLPQSMTEAEYVSRVLPHKIKLSMDYQRRRSFLSDLGILLKTVVGSEH